MPKLPVFLLRDFSSSVYTIREQSDSKYFELSANQNNSDGLLWLGKIYYEGKEPTKDFKEFIVSALKRVVHINYRTAYKFIKRCAKLKNSDAQYMLGTMYRDGKGVIKNKEKAAEYFKLSEEQGNIEAGRALLKLYDADKCCPTLYYYY